jgi:protein SCO1
MNITRAKSQTALYALVAISISLPSIIGLFVLFSGNGSNAAMTTGPARPALDQAMGHCVKMAESEPVGREYNRTLMQYHLPDVTLTTADGSRVSVLEALDSGHPVMLNFIYTSCSTICPVLSSTFVQVRSQLNQDATPVRYVSISIDPEQDTPDALARYAQRYGADENWQFFTGSREEIMAVQRAFDAYRGNKMSHQPLTFLRVRAGAPWLRIEGFPKASELVREYRVLFETDPMPVHAPG